MVQRLVRLASRQPCCRSLVASVAGASAVETCINPARSYGSPWFLIGGPLVRHFVCVAQALGVVYAFGSSQPGVQSLILTLLCLMYTVLHCVLAPLRNPEANTMQTWLLVCLTVVALSGTPAADSAQRAVASVDSTASDSLASQLQLLFGIAIPVVVIAWAFGGPVLWANRRNCKFTCSKPSIPSKS